MNIRVGAEVSVGGIAIQGFRSLDEAVEFVISADGQVTPGFAIAINPEKVIRYQGDSALRKAVSDATLRYPDGIGVTLAMRAKGVHTTRVAGVDLWERLMRCAAQTGTPVYLLGGAPGVVGQVSRRAIAEMPGLVIAGTQHGYFENEDAVLDDICQSDAKILFVAMGSPKQEVFIHKVRQRRPDCFCMGVGGTFDVFIGRVQRAPVIMQRLGLEWFYRLLRQPSRIGRQTNLAKFALLLLLGRL